MRPITVPRLPKGRGYKGPEFYGCCNTGLAPCIFHSAGPASTLLGRKSLATTPCTRRSHAFQQANMVRTTTAGKCGFTRAASPPWRNSWRFCGAQIIENENMRCEHAETLDKARKGDVAAAIRLGDY